MPATACFKLNASSRNRPLRMNGVPAARSVMQNNVTAHSSDKYPIALTAFNDLFHSKLSILRIFAVVVVVSPDESSRQAVN